MHGRQVRCLHLWEHLRMNFSPLKRPILPSLKGQAGFCTLAPALADHQFQLPQAAFQFSLLSHSLCHGRKLPLRTLLIFLSVPFVSLLWSLLSVKIGVSKILSSALSSISSLSQGPHPSPQLHLVFRAKFSPNVI